MKRLLWMCDTAWSVFTVFAQNPLVTHLYTADPAARVFDGALYVYSSTDIIPPAGRKADDFYMPGYHVFSLEEGTTWKDHGSILDQNDVPWGQTNSLAMWAPDCIFRDGTYYFYFPAAPKDRSGFRRIGVGTSAHPTGPFTWETNYIDGVSGIDPGVFMDDDDQAYLYYGGGQDLYVAPLKENMKEISGDPVKIEHLPASYKEASFMLKHDGIYFFTFAHAFPHEDYTIGYASGYSPTGPFIYRGKIMDNISGGTNHHSIERYKDQWILFYHWWDISGFNKLRSMRADYMTFHKDGSINKVIPSLRGIGTPGLGELIQVDRYNEIKGCKTAMVSGGEPVGWMVCETQLGSYVRFNRVDFSGAKKMQARMASGQTFGNAEVRLDSPTGALVARIPVQHTGGWDTWKTVELDLNEPIDGIHDLVVVFNPHWGGHKTLNLNWLKLIP